MNLKKYLIICNVILAVCFQCTTNKDSISIKVTNTLDMARTNETISLPWADIAAKASALSPDTITISETTTGAGESVLAHQAVDNDGDGQVDEIIFQSDFGAGETKKFMLAAGEPGRFESKAFGRHVPERMDDFAWENDKVAFRMYGPALQATGEISSGVDVWSKNTSELVINKWYHPDYGSYHVDQGQGGDFYKVGPSCGCGGIAVWQNSNLSFSKNYVTWKRLANGPIRVIFELSYDAWETDGKKISEVKRISLDAGQNLNRFVSFFRSDDLSEFDCAIGIIKRDIGEAKSNMNAGFLRYWQPIDEQNGTTGCAIVMDPEKMMQITEIQDHNLVICKVNVEEPLVYYAGACWDKSEGFATVEDWDVYLEYFAETLANPLEVQF